MKSTNWLNPFRQLIIEYCAEPISSFVNT